MNPDNCSMRYSEFPPPPDRGALNTLIHPPTIKPNLAAKLTRMRLRKAKGRK